MHCSYRHMLLQVRGFRCTYFSYNSKPVDMFTSTCTAAATASVRPLIIDNDNTIKQYTSTWVAIVCALCGAAGRHPRDAQDGATPDAAARARQNAGRAPEAPARAAGWVLRQSTCLNVCVLCTGAHCVQCALFFLLCSTSYPYEYVAKLKSCWSWRACAKQCWRPESCARASLSADV